METMRPTAQVYSRIGRPRISRRETNFIVPLGPLTDGRHPSSTLGALGIGAAVGGGGGSGAAGLLSGLPLEPLLVVSEEQSLVEL